MTHPSDCTGCPTCNAEFRSLLSMTPQQYSEWLTAQDRTRGLRTAAANNNNPHTKEPNTMHYLLRATEQHPPRSVSYLRTASQVATDFARRAVAPPNPYASVLLRAAERPEARAYAARLFTDRGVAPDPYAIAFTLRALEAE